MNPDDVKKLNFQSTMSNSPIARMNLVRDQNKELRAREAALARQAAGETLSTEEQRLAAMGPLTDDEKARIKKYQGVSDMLLRFV